jgi:hypothetical protein
MRYLIHIHIKIEEYLDKHILDEREI